MFLEESDLAFWKLVKSLTHEISSHFDLYRPSLEEVKSLLEKNVEV